jgi:hypothetical protein
MARKPSEWNMFVKKVFEEGRKKNPGFKFKDALKEASDRKNEMGKAINTAANVVEDVVTAPFTKKARKSHKKSKKSKKSKKAKKSRKSRKSKK